MFKPKPLSWLEPAIITGSAIPFGVILMRAFTGGLGANPIATVMNQLGLLALIFLVSSLSCTPLKALFGWNWPIRIRRVLGLFAFGTACTHFLVYVVLDQMLVIRALVADITKRPFIIVGFLALVCLAPLAATSTKRAVQRMGFRKWKRLHRLAYVAVALALLHFLLRVKKDLGEPLIYGTLVGALFLVRIGDFIRSRIKKRAGSRPDAVRIPP